MVGHTEARAVKHRYAPAAVALGLLFCAACGHVSSSARAGAGAGAGAGNTAGSFDTASAGNSDASAPDASSAAGAAAGGACGNLPIPKEHRAVAPACPTARGSQGTLDTTACSNRSGISCTRDADCSAGKNGRCFLNGDPCQTVCSYDQCLTDADCAAGPCICRNNETELAPNACLPLSNCRTDADCGCGYCSPSAVPNALNCGPGDLTYVCHAANDECTDASECGAGAYCAYDAGTVRWECAFCVPVPHP